jgi:hypothetical protein
VADKVSQVNELGFSRVCLGFPWPKPNCASGFLSLGFTGVCEALLPHPYARWLFSDV